MVRKIITIIRDVSNISNFDVNINRINFDPREMIVRSVNVSSTAPNAISFTVYSNLVEDSLFSIGVGADTAANIMPNTSWIPRGGNGVWNFSMLDVTGAAMVFPAGAIYLYMQLEFIRE